MKTALVRALTALKRAWRLYQVRSIEINLQGQLDVLPYVRDADTRDAMAVAIRTQRKALARARAEYQATLPPGQRLVWGVA